MVIKPNPKGKFMSNKKKGANINNILKKKKEKVMSTPVKKTGVLDVKKAEVSKSEQKKAEIIVPTTPNNKEKRKGAVGGRKEAEYLLFIDFIATPRFERGGLDQKDFAKQYGVDEGTLSAWKKRPDFYKEVNKRRRVWGKDRTADMLNALYHQVIDSKKPTGRHVLVWLQYFEDFAPKSKYEDDTPMERKLDPAQRAELAKSLINSGIANLEQARKFAEKENEDDEDE